MEHTNEAKKNTRSLENQEEEEEEATKNERKKMILILLLFASFARKQRRLCKNICEPNTDRANERANRQAQMAYTTKELRHLCVNLATVHLIRLPICCRCRSVAATASVCM